MTSRHSTHGGARTAVTTGIKMPRKSSPLFWGRLKLYVYQMANSRGMTIREHTDISLLRSRAVLCTAYTYPSQELRIQQRFNSFNVIVWINWAWGTLWKSIQRYSNESSVKLIIFHCLSLCINLWENVSCAKCHNVCHLLLIWKSQNICLISNQALTTKCQIIFCMYIVVLIIVSYKACLGSWIWFPTYYGTFFKPFIPQCNLKWFTDVVKTDTKSTKSEKPQSTQFQVLLPAPNLRGSNKWLGFCVRFRPYCWVKLHVWTGHFQM